MHLRYLWCIMHAKLYQLIQTIVFLFFIFVLPTLLFDKTSLLATWPFLASIASGFVLSLSQPPVRFFSKNPNDQHDRHSVTLLMASGILIFLIPALEFLILNKSPACVCNWISILGLSMAIGGLAFRVYAIYVLGKFFTSSVQIQNDHRLIEHGPYKYLRHPSYTGALVMALGVSFMLRSYAGLLFCVFGFFPTYMYRIHAEEIALSSKLGDVYQAYQSRTKKLIPFIY